MSSARAAAGSCANQTGVAAEEIALRLYRNVRISASRWRCEAGEIDLILESAGQVIFVEVKARRSLADAAFSLSRRQQERIGAAAAFWLAERNAPELEARFDVVLVDGQGRAERIENAFQFEAA